jgi:aspartate/methionine/tyrosine aminotransferase
MSIKQTTKLETTIFTKNVDQALSIYINQLVYDIKRQGRKVTTLSLGEAFFKIPMFDFSCLDFERGYHYSDTKGIPELRMKIAEYYQKFYKAEVLQDEVMISAGSKAIIFMCMRALASTGTEVLIHEPAWVSYEQQAKLLDAKTKFIPYNTSINKFDHYITSKTKLLIINNPNNPSGRLYTRKELEVLHKMSIEKNFYLLVDEAYSDFVIDETFVTMADVAKTRENTIIVNSLSKNMGMSGWRIGYMISNQQFLQEINKINQHIITCAPTILQMYLARYFDDIISITLPQVRKVVNKRNRCIDMMEKLGIKRMGGNCTFYFFVDIENFPSDSMNFAIHLLINDGIAVVPGSAYGTSTERFIRVSIGTEPDNKIWDALRAIKRLIETTKFDCDKLKKQINNMNLPEFRQHEHSSDEEVSLAGLK